MKFQKVQTPWNKGSVGVMVAWNKIPVSRLEKKNCEACYSSYKRNTNQGLKAWERRRFCSKSCKTRGNKHRLGHKHSIETRKKMSDSHPKGEESPWWKKGRTEIVLNKSRHHGFEYKIWRDMVFQRDGYKCKISTSGCETYVEAHHILSWREYPELRYEITNGITLCRSHHPKGREKEKRLAPFFAELVSVSKV